MGLPRVAVTEEVFLPFGAAGDELAPATAVRSTVVFTSQRGLRARGLFDAYLAVCAPAYREHMRALTAGAWMSMDLARAHYEACDRLKLERRVMEEIGQESGRLLNETIFSLVIRLSREAGVTPWTALPHTNRLIDRTWRGSTCGVFRLGPKEARLEWLGQPLADIPYFRTAFGGFVHGVLGMFARVVFVRELPRYCTSTTLGYRCSWV